MDKKTPSKGQDSQLSPNTLHAKLRPTQETHEPQLIAQQHHYQGPIPDPNMLAAYENIEQGLASRIVTMAEQEQAHRHKNEDRALTAQIDDVKDERRAEQRGQWFAFLVVIAILLASGYMTHAGFANAGAWLAGATLAACAAVFITRKRGSNEQEIVQEQPSSSNKKRKI